MAIYVFLASGLSAPFFYFEAIAEEPVRSIVTNFAAGLAQLIVSAVGVWRCYLANGGRSGQDFAETFIAVAWVVGVRIFLVILLPAIGVFATATELAATSVETAMVGFSILYFWRICVHLHWVREHRPSAA